MSKRAQVQEFDVPIAGGSKNVPQDDPGYTNNLYAEKVSDEIYTLKPTPGTVLKYQFGVNGGGRGIISVNGRLFGVRGYFFQEIVDGSPVTHGELLSNLNKVAMISCVPSATSALHPQILIVDEDRGYHFDLTTNTYTQLTSGGGPFGGFVGGGRQAAFCAGRAVVFKPGTNEYQCSDLYDFSSWDGLAFKSCNTLNTSLVACASNGDLLYLFSNGGYEIWQDNGDSSVIPFSRILAGDNIGCMAPDSLLKSERYMYWLGGNIDGRGVVYRHSGGGLPQRLSDHPTERNIAAMAAPETAIAMTYQSLGHIFYLMTFREGNRTFVFDSTIGLWAERCQRNPLDASILALPFINITVHDGDILAMDYRDGKVDLVDNDTYSDRGNPIVRDRKLSVVPKEADFMTYYGSVELFCETGNPA